MTFNIKSAGIAEFTKFYTPTINHLENFNLKISLAFNVVSSIIVEGTLKIFNIHYLHKLNDDVKIKILHLESVLFEKQLPRELRNYRVAVTRNLPSLKAYHQKDIKEKCNKCFAEFKEKIENNRTHDDSLNEYYNKTLQKINPNINKLSNQILHAKKSSCFTGVCHAMICRVARDFLDSTNEDASLLNHASNFTKGVDEKVAGLQLFMDSQSEDFSSFPWTNLDAVDSLLGLAATPINTKVDFPKNGLFHIALPIGNAKHSLLLNLQSQICQFLDPNLGVFEFPTSELKNFLKNHLSFYIRTVTGKEDTETVDSFFSKNDCAIYSESNKNIEIRQLEKATKHKWFLEKQNCQTKLVWQREYTFNIVNGRLIKVPL